jgi:hypothetical protein
MRDPETLRFIHAGRRRLSREHREKISKSKKGGNPVQGPPPPVDVAEAHDDGAAVAVPINRWGKTRRFTLGFNKTTDATLQRFDRARSTAFVAVSGRVGQRRIRFYFFFHFRHRFVLGGKNVTAGKCVHTLTIGLNYYSSTSRNSFALVRT